MIFSIKRLCVASLASDYKLLGATASNLLIDEKSKTLQRLYYEFVKVHHPDVNGDDGSRLKEGIDAYERLRAASEKERRDALQLVSSKCEAPPPRNRQKSMSTPEFWRHTPTVLDKSEEEFYEYLKTLDGNDKVRFHRPFMGFKGGRGRSGTQTGSDGSRSHPHDDFQSKSIVFGVGFTCFLYGIIIVVFVRLASG